MLLPTGTRVAEAHMSGARITVTTEVVGEDVFAVVPGQKSPLRVELHLDR